MKARACSPYLRRCGNISMGVDLKQLCATTHGFARHDNVSLSFWRNFFVSGCQPCSRCLRHGVGRTCSWRRDLPQRGLRRRVSALGRDFMPTLAATGGGESQALPTSCTAQGLTAGPSAVWHQSLLRLEPQIVRGSHNTSAEFHTPSFLVTHPFVSTEPPLHGANP
jgi:hypothetical protein